MKDGAIGALGGLTFVSISRRPQPCTISFVSAIISPRYSFVLFTPVEEFYTDFSGDDQARHPEAEKLRMTV